MAIAARIPMMATTIISSIRVKPRRFLNCARCRLKSLVMFMVVSTQCVVSYLLRRNSNGNAIPQVPGSSGVSATALAVDLASAVSHSDKDRHRRLITQGEKRHDQGLAVRYLRNGGGLAREHPRRAARPRRDPAAFRGLGTLPRRLEELLHPRHGEGEQGRVAVDDRRRH